MIHEGEHWVNVHPAALSHAFHPDHEVSIVGDGRKRYVLADAPPGRAAAVYTAKYGATPGAVLLRLAPAD